MFVVAAVLVIRLPRVVCLFPFIVILAMLHDPIAAVRGHAFIVYVIAFLSVTVELVLMVVVMHVLVVVTIFVVVLVAGQVVIVTVLPAFSGM